MEAFPKEKKALIIYIYSNYFLVRALNVFYGIIHCVRGVSSVVMVSKIVKAQSLSAINNSEERKIKVLQLLANFFVLFVVSSN